MKDWQSRCLAGRRLGEEKSPPPAGQQGSQSGQRALGAPPCASLDAR